MLKRGSLSLLLGLGLAGAAGCPESSPPLGSHDTTETVIRGVAPLNARLGNAPGHVTAYIHEPSSWEEGETVEGIYGCAPCKAYSASTDERGYFEIKMGDASGQITLEASGGDYIEPASGKLIHHQGEKLRAALPDVKHLKTREVAITPWTEIAYARGGVDGYAESLRILTETLTCNGPNHADVFKIPPAAPQDGIHSVATPRELAYVYLGAFSKLADDLSAMHGVQPGGARLSSMKLAKVLAADFANGRIDGRGHGDGVVYLFENVALPADVLRQQLAQSVRRFLHLHKPEGDTGAWGNESTVGETAMLDFLRCICDSTDPALGPPGAPLDLDGPALAIVAPQPQSYVAASQDVICEAQDQSDVATMDVVFVDDSNAVVAQARGVVKATGQGATRRFVAPLRIETLNTGRVRVRCEATDAWGNASSTTEPLFINRGAVAPTMTIGGEPSERLQGRVEVTCDCEQDPYSTGCALEVTGADVTLEVVGEPQTRKNTYAWDTRGVLDGNQYTLKCANTTQGLTRPVVQTKPVRVKNYENGSAHGAVYLDTSVRGMQVAAYAYDDGEIGKWLGGADVVDDGNFEFEMSTEHRGPILLRAEYSRSPNKPASFQNVPLDRRMSCSNAVLTLLLEHYEPGEALSGLSLNVASTMHEALAVGLFRMGNEPTFVGDGEHIGAVRTAYTLVSNYLSGGDADFDPRRTPVADLSHSERDSAHNQDVLGLMHVGLSRQAADAAVQHCGGNPEQITISEVIAAMKRDLEDGQLDGKRHGELVELGCGALLTPDFFRIDLARAIRRWLDKTPYVGHDHDLPVNKSGLNTAILRTARSPLLKNLSKHHSQLFGGRPGEEYDGDGPTIRWRAYGADHNEMVLANATVGATSIMFVVDASDDTGIADMKVTLNTQDQNNLASGNDAGRGEYLIRTAQLDGPQSLVVHAVDGKGNSKVESIGFTVDRIMPKAAFAVSELWINDGASYHLGATLSKENMTVQVYLNDVAVGNPVRVEGKSVAVPVPLNCGATHRVGMEMRDIAGNINRKHQVVHCDDKAPTIGQLSSQHTQVQNGNIVPLALQVQEDPEHMRLAEGKDADLLEIRWDRLDDRDDNATPTMNFSVGDIENGSVGSPPNALRVSYRYMFRGVNESHERGWTPITCSREGVCKLPLSYQALLPEEIKRQSIRVARQQNFVAYSNPNDLHSVIVKVEDLAGNTTFADWTFRMKLYSSPVTISCGWNDQATGKSLVPSTVAELSKREHALTKVSAVSGLGLDGNTLTPAGNHRIELQDDAVEWRVKRVMTKRNTNGTVSRYDCDGERRRNAGLDACMNAGGFYYFDDGECVKDFAPNSQSGFDRDVNHTARQTIRPAQPYIDLNSATPAGERDVLTSSELMPNGGPAWLFESGQFIDAHRTVVRKRHGWRLQPTHKRCHRMVETDHAYDLTISRIGAYLPQVTTTGDTPDPLAIAYQGCNSGEIVWSCAQGTAGIATAR